MAVVMKINMMKIREKKEKGKKKRELVKDQNQLQTNAAKMFNYPGVFNGQLLTSETLRGMGTSFGCSDLWDCLGGQVLVMIGQ